MSDEEQTPGAKIEETRTLTTTEGGDATDTGKEGQSETSEEGNGAENEGDGKNGGE